MSVTLTYQILLNLNCNLDCFYCYESKNSKVNKQEYIKDYLAYCFERDKEREADIVVDLIGGETLLYPNLVDFTCQEARFLAQQYDRKLTINISTNGTTLGREDVREVLLRHKRFLSMGISIDGPKDIHDKYRITNDGKGSYGTIVENLPWLFKHFCQSKLGVKATFTNETMHRYAEAVKHIFGLGFREVAANLVYEEIADGEVILPQLMEVAEYLAENPQLILQQMPRDMPIRRHLETRSANYCGSCEFMTCLGFDGLVYGCNRFATMEEDRISGVLVDGVISPCNEEFVQEVINQWQEYPEECMECPVKMFCPSCVAAPYEEGDVKAYLAEKRMCEWTYSLSLARNYLYSIKKEKQLVGKCDCSTG